MRFLFMSMFSLASLFISKCGSTTVTSEPCFQDREVVDLVENMKVVCTTTEAFVLFQRQDNNERYSICNSEDFEIEKGASYTISGKKYETMPNERWPGTPFEITKLKK